MDRPSLDPELERRTRTVVERLYDAYFAGDSDGMVDNLSSDVWVRFLGRVDIRGIEQARVFFRENTALLLDLRFNIKKLIVDGNKAAAIWEEQARLQDGRPYHNHGVDVFSVDNDEVTLLHVSNDIGIHREHFPR